MINPTDQLVYATVSDPLVAPYSLTSLPSPAGTAAASACAPSPSLVGVYYMHPPDAPISAHTTPAVTKTDSPPANAFSDTAPPALHKLAEHTTTSYSTSDPLDLNPV